jgi:hypothetical protein
MASLPALEVSLGLSRNVLDILPGFLRRRLHLALDKNALSDDGSQHWPERTADEWEHGLEDGQGEHSQHKNHRP